eukprot:6807663-Pyramimonas_sp.AAC.1
MVSDYLPVLDYDAIEESVPEAGSSGKAYIQGINTRIDKYIQGIEARIGKLSISERKDASVEAKAGGSLSCDRPSEVASHKVTGAIELAPPSTLDREKPALKAVTQKK